MPTSLRAKKDDVPVGGRVVSLHDDVVLVLASVVPNKPQLVSTYGGFLANNVQFDRHIPKALEHEAEFVAHEGHVVSHETRLERDVVDVVAPEKSFDRVETRAPVPRRCSGDAHGLHDARRATTFPCSPLASRRHAPYRT